MIGEHIVFRSDSAEWETPQKLFDELNDEFHFTLDVCSTDENAKCEKHFTKEQDGLIQDWSGETVWCNPPYGREICNWVRKCSEFSVGGGIAVMLLPARTDTKWFHDYVYKKAEIRFLKGRLRFNNAPENAPFPSMIVVFRKEIENG